MKLKRARSILAPEVVQTSAMDCGPAALKCLLEGHGVGVSYGRLREACQTDVDGTTIDTLEDLGQALGLDTEQIMIPPDHVALDGAHALPAIVVVRLPSGLTHFVVVWRRYGRWLEVMDPAVGRRWTSVERFRDELYVHETAAPAAAWRDWAGSEDFLAPLRQRLSLVGCDMGARDALLGSAVADASYLGLARLDAATRLVQGLCASRALKHGRPAQSFLCAIVKDETPGTTALLSTHCSVQEKPTDSADDGEVVMHGAILIRCRGRGQESPRADSLPQELATALREPEPRPLAELWAKLREERATVVAALLIALVASAASVLLEALLFRSFLELGDTLGTIGYRIGAGAAVVVFLIALLVLDMSLAGLLWRTGRHLDIRMRRAVFAKIPRLSDRHFHSRLTSDMAERAHLTHVLRILPEVAGQYARTVLEAVFTAMAIAWLVPQSAAVALTAACLAVVAPLVAQPLLQGRDLKTRTHTGALARFNLDAMQGCIPIRAHNASDLMRRGHESLLVDWARSCISLQRAVAVTDCLQLFVGCGLAALILAMHRDAVDFPAALLLLYWTLKLPFLGQEAALIARQYPALRNETLRLLEPLSAPDEAVTSPSPAPPAAESERGIRIDLSSVTIRAGGHVVLDDIDLHIASGEHVAIVGKSGAGKSSLLGLLLGWHRASAGTALVDGRPLDARALDQLREHTAWVDPANQLWNRSLYDNLLYGTGDRPIAFAPLLDAADLKDLLQQMPDGLQANLGEGGTRVSGGQGQRVRFGRALARADARLVLLDEPFRGLDRGERSRLLNRARDWWRGATLLLVIHDIEDSRAFERVLVIDGGRIVEDGPPSALADDAHSRYARLLAAEKEAAAMSWNSHDWRRWWLDDARIEERFHA